MTYLEAAYSILRAAHMPLHFEEITARALDGRLIVPQGLTPAATMASRLYTDTKLEGSRFIRLGQGCFGLVEWQPRGIDAEIHQINDATRQQLALHIEAMPPERFEALIGELLIQMGFDENTVQVTRRSGDGGIDVVGCYRAAGIAEVSAAVQVKRWRNNVQAPTVTQLRGSLQVHQQGIIITSGGFSKGARDEAAATGKSRIGLIDGQELLDLLIKFRVGIAEKTFTVLSLDDEWWGNATPSPSGGVGESLPAISPAPAEASAGRSVQILTGRKPTSFTLFGNKHPADSWRAVLVGVCVELAQLHGDQFLPAALTVRGKRRQHVATTCDGMVDPVRIPTSNLWVEGNQSAISALKVADRLLTALGHRGEDLKVDCQST